MSVPRSTKFRQFSLEEKTIEDEKLSEDEKTETSSEDKNMADKNFEDASKFIPQWLKQNGISTNLTRVLLGLVVWLCPIRG